jgi:hypothetical protein
MKDESLTPLNDLINESAKGWYKEYYRNNQGEHFELIDNLKKIDISVVLNDLSSEKILFAHTEDGWYLLNKLN